MKFGRIKSVRDPRTLSLGDVLQRAKLPAIPSSYRFDERYPSPPIPTPMFGNDAHGCCVISARAHSTLRFERFEQGAIIPISTDDVLTEWWRENGGTEDGLSMLSSMKKWRSNGWHAAGQDYRCHAFADLDPCVTEFVQAAIFLFGSLQGGFDLPYSVTKHMDRTDTWDLVSGPESAGDPDAGHAMAIVGYDENGLDLITWGRLQRCTWAWFEGYTDELFAVVDDLNPWHSVPAFDVHALEAYLGEIS